MKIAILILALYKYYYYDDDDDDDCSLCPQKGKDC